jgi:hypothetical protein
VTELIAPLVLEGQAEEITFTPNWAPGKLAQIAYGLLPRDVFISVEQRTPGTRVPFGFTLPSRLNETLFLSQ